MHKYLRVARVVIFLLLFNFFVFGISGLNIVTAEANNSPSVHFTKDDLPSSLNSNQKYKIKVKIKNISNKTWDNKNLYLSYHWFKDGREVIWDGIRSNITKDIQPNEEVTVNVSLLTPDDSGKFKLEWDLVKENKFWYSDKNNLINNEKKIKVNKKKYYSAKVLDSSSSLFMFGGKSNYKVTLKNTGTISWDKDENIYLSYHILDSKGEILELDGIRTSLGQTVYPGEKVIIDATIDTFDFIGNYKIQWDLVKEGEFWFKDLEEFQTISIDAFILNTWIKYIVMLITFLFICFIIKWLYTFLREKELLSKGILEKINSGINFSKRMIRYLSKNIDGLWFVVSNSVKTVIFSVLINVNMSWDIILLVISTYSLFSIVIGLVKNKVMRLTIITSVSSIVTFIVVSDLIYFRYFDDVITIPVLLYASQVSSLGSSIWELFGISDILFFVDLLILPFIVMKFQNEKRKKITNQLNPLKIMLIVFLISISLLPIGFKINDIIKDEGGYYSKTFLNKILVRELGVVNYHLFDTYKFFQRRFNSPEVSDELKKEIETWFSKRNYYSKLDHTYGMSKGKNLIVIMEESLQDFVINYKVNGKEVTPNLNKLINESIYFENFYDQTAQGRTSDGELTSLTSLHPLKSGSVSFQYPGNDFDSLPKILQMNEYETFSAHPNRGDFWNRKVTHRNYGFESSMFKEDFSPGEQIGWGLSDEEFFKQASERMTGLQEPFFSYLITLSNHHPYDSIPEKYKRLNLKDMEGSLLGNYLQSVSYVDYAIGKFIKDLKDEGIYKDTIIAIYGDHDAGIGREQLLKFAGNKKNEASIKKLDSVPFIIHDPTMKKSVRIDKVSGHLDITPSLLHLLGIKFNSKGFLGNNPFINNNNNLVVFRNGSYISEEYTFLTNNGTFSSGTCYLYDSDKKVNKEKCKEDYERAQNRLNISDTLIRTNLLSEIELKEMKKNKSKN